MPIAQATGREPCTFVRTGDVGREQLSIGIMGDNELGFEERVTDDASGREIRRVGHRLPRAPHPS